MGRTIRVNGRRVDSSTGAFLDAPGVNVTERADGTQREGSRTSPRRDPVGTVNRQERQVLNAPIGDDRGFGQTIKEEFDRPVFEGEGFKEKAISAITSPKTTLALGATLLTLLGGGAIAGRLGLGGTRVASSGSITRTAIQIGRQGNTMTAQRAIVGRGGKPIIDALFKTLGKAAEVTKRFATNPRSIAFSTRMLDFAKSPAGIVTLVGSYPFAGFVKEEALQTLGFASKSALDAGDLEGAELAIKEQEDILDPSSWEKLIGLVPFANVSKQLLDFFKAAQTKLNQDKRLLEKRRGEREFEGTSVGEDIAARDVAQAKAREQTGSDIAARDARQAEQTATQNEERIQRDIDFAVAQAEREAQAAANTAEFEERRRIADEAFRERTLLFEAIRKRNSGITLSEEELALLEQFGLSRDAFGQGAGGRSTVQF